MIDMEEQMNPKKTARQAGFYYLLLAIFGSFAFFFKEGLIVYSNAQVTADNILASQTLFTLSIVSELVTAIAWLLAAFYLYKLFRPVHNNASLLMLILVVIGSAIMCINVINPSAALLLLQPPGYLTVFSTVQLQALALFFLRLYEYGVSINGLFFGGWLLPLAYLIPRSNYFPKTFGKILSLLLIIGALGYIIDTLIFFLPPLHIELAQFTFVGEVVLLLWLLIKGTNTK